MNGNNRCWFYYFIFAGAMPGTGSTTVWHGTVDLQLYINENFGYFFSFFFCFMFSFLFSFLYVIYYIPCYEVCCACVVRVLCVLFLLPLSFLFLYKKLAVTEEEFQTKTHC